MDLLEYQAKELFREVGIPVLPSQCIDDPRAIKSLRIPYPVVLKSQVRAGGRGKAGGIRFVENTIDAIAASRAIFNLSILGEYPQVLLAETKYDADQEFYLAVSLDYASRRPVLLGSALGGINLEQVLEHIQQVIVDQEFSPFYARKLALKMGVSGRLIEAVSDLIQKMYQLFEQKDLDKVEINPLGVSASGELMALDGKITANNAALRRHPDLAQWVAQMLNSPMDDQTIEHLYSDFVYNSLTWVQRDGNVAVICKGIGLAMGMVDAIHQAGGKTAGYWLLHEETHWEQQPLSLMTQLQNALAQISQHPSIKVIVINLLSSFETDPGSWVQDIIAATTPYFQPLAASSAEWTEKSSASRRSRVPLQLVVRIASKNLDPAIATCEFPPLHWIESLDSAISLAVSLGKVGSK